MSCTLRKLGEQHLVSQAYGQAQGDFVGLQYCGQQNGTEKMALSITAARQFNSTLDHSQADLKDAFQNVRRHEMLAAIRTRAPALYPEAAASMPKSQAILYFGRSEGISAVSATEGTQQGAPSSPLKFALGTQAFNETLRQLAGDEAPGALFKTYADDSHALSTPANVATVIRAQVHDGPCRGLFANLTKHRILLGDTDTVEEADERTRRYRELGIPEECIRRHPRLAATADEAAAQAAGYGVTVVGTPVGAPAFIEAALDTIWERIAAEFDRVDELDEPQLQFLFLRMCLQGKLTHILRTLPPPVSRQICERFDRRMRLSLARVMDVPDIPDPVVDLIATEEEGAAIIPLTRIADAAFVAGVVAARDDISAIHSTLRAAFDTLQSGQNPSTQPIPLLAEFAEAAARLHADGAPSLADILSRPPTRHLQRELAQARHRQTAAAIESRLRDAQADAAPLAIFLSSRSQYGTKWLTAVPRTPAVTMSGIEFQTALRARYVLPQPFIPVGSPCVCFRHVPLDAHGIHLAKCNDRQALTIATHDRVQGELQALFTACGKTVKLARAGMFARDEAPRDETRTDLIISEPGKANSTTDVRITHAAPSPSDQVNTATLRAGTMAARSEAEKRGKYGAKCKAIGLAFFPAVFDSAGYFGNEFVAIFHQITSHYARSAGIPPSAVRTYWARRIGVAVQSTGARAVLNRAYHNVTRRMGNGPDGDESQWSGVVADIDDTRPTTFVSPLDALSEAIDNPNAAGLGASAGGGAAEG